MLKKIVISHLAAFLAISASLALGQTAGGISVKVTGIFDYPGAGTLTAPQKINDRGDIVGFYLDSAGASHGFVRASNGAFSPPLTDPNDDSGLTEGRGINNSRMVCGDYLEANRYHGFFYTGENFLTYDIAPWSYWTFVLGVNNAGDFCGSTIVDKTAQLGFVSIAGTVRTFAVLNGIATYAFQLNDAGQVCGYYLDAAGIAHGYYFEPDGTTHAPVDPAGSVDTSLFGNNNQNIIVGRYADDSGATHGIVFFPPARFLVFDYPGSTYTSLNGINARNQIVGRYTDSAGLSHGFIAQLTKESRRGARELPLAVPGAARLERPASRAIALRPAD